MFRSRMLPLLAVALLLSACAATPARKAASASKSADKEALALYERLEQDSQRYASGLELLRSGETATAQAEMTAAVDDLRAAATRCSELAGCEQQRFVAAFDALLRQGIGNGEGAAEIGGTTPEAGGLAGESSPVIAAVPELGRSVTLLKGRELGELIELNGPVKAALEEWLTQYRPSLLLAYENYQYMRHLMWPEYEKAGLPEALLFGMMAKESGGKVHAVSRSGASGPLQFMYATGMRFGLGKVGGFDQRFDPRLSARANAAYVNEQLAIFNDNLELVVGAYNGGEGAMRRRVARLDGTPSFWDPRIYYDVSQETREYVPMVLAAAWLFLHPERYNLRFPKIEGGDGRIRLRRPASIAELTICFGQDGNPDGWFRTLRNLNPQLDPQQTVAAGTELAVPRRLEAVYARDCAGGRWPELAADLHSAIVPAPPPMALAAKGKGARTGRAHTVRKGDTLMAISRRYGCTVPKLASANALRAPQYRLRIGQVLQIPRCTR